MEDEFPFQRGEFQVQNVNFPGCSQLLFWITRIPCSRMEVAIDVPLQIPTGKQKQVAIWSRLWWELWFVNQAGNVGYHTLYLSKNNFNLSRSRLKTLFKAGLGLALPQHIQFGNCWIFWRWRMSVSFFRCWVDFQSFIFFLFAKIVIHRNKCCMRRGVGYVWGHIFFCCFSFCFSIFPMVSQLTGFF